MDTYTESNPLPMRIPATDPPVKGDHVDIGVWAGGWRYMTDADRMRHERMPAEDRATYARVFEDQGAAMAELEAHIEAEKER